MSFTLVPWPLWFRWWVRPSRPHCAGGTPAPTASTRAAEWSAWSSLLS